jgi:hypothetical protein
MSVRFQRRSSRIQSSPVAAVPAADTPAEKWAKGLTTQSEQGENVCLHWQSFKEKSKSIDARPLHDSNVQSIARNMMDNGFLRAVINYNNYF